MYLYCFLDSVQLTQQMDAMLNYKIEFVTRYYSE